MEKIVLECEMEMRWIPHFLGMLKTMQFLGSIGSSRIVGIYSDGDGDFRPKFTMDGINIKDIKVANPIYDDSCQVKDAICDYFYDAG